MLTDSKIRSAKPLEKSYKLTDSQGRYLTLSASAAKLWYFRYRLDGKESRLTFGPVPHNRTVKKYHSAMLNGKCHHEEDRSPSRKRSQSKLKYLIRPRRPTSKSRIK